MNILMTNPIFVGELIIVLSILINAYIRYKIAMKTLEFSLLDLQLKTKIDSSIIEILDTFIQDCFNEYLILNSDPINNKFIGEEEEKKIRDELIDLISNRISPTLYKQLTVYYNAKSIPTILSNKIYELVLAYTITQNAPKDKEEG